MQTDRMIIGVIGLLIIICAGAYTNPKWKSMEGLSDYGNGLMRAIIGIFPYVAIIGYMVSQDLWMVIAVLAIVILSANPFMKLNKDGYPAVKYTIFLLSASAGAYARIMLTMTIVGILPNMMIKHLATMSDQEFKEYLESTKD